MIREKQMSSPRKAPAGVWVIVGLVAAFFVAMLGWMQLDGEPQIPEPLLDLGVEVVTSQVMTTRGDWLISVNAKAEPSEVNAAMAKAFPGAEPKLTPGFVSGTFTRGTGRLLSSSVMAGKVVTDHHAVAWTGHTECLAPGEKWTNVILVYRPAPLVGLHVALADFLPWLARRKPAPMATRLVVPAETCPDPAIRKRAQVLRSKS